MYGINPSFIHILNTVHSSCPPNFDTPKKAKKND